MNHSSSFHSSFELEQGDYLDQYQEGYFEEYTSDFERTLSRMAWGGLIWLGIFVILAVLSLVMIFVMNAIDNLLGVGIFLLMAGGLLWNAFLPYRNANNEINEYDDLLSDGELLLPLSDYPLSAFYHYMSVGIWLVFVIAVLMSWISVVFLVIAFFAKHQATFLVFALLLMLAFVAIYGIITWAIAYKDACLYE